MSICHRVPNFVILSITCFIDYACFSSPLKRKSFLPGGGGGVVAGIR